MRRHLITIWSTGKTVFMPKEGRSKQTGSIHQQRYKLNEKPMYCFAGEAVHEGTQIK
jgi:hypothetical protein